MARNDGMPRLMTFSTRGERPGKPKPGDWTQVICHQFDNNGERMKDQAILTAFGGSDGGSSEAKRLCKLLNDAVVLHHRDPNAGKE